MMCLRPVLFADISKTQDAEVGDGTTSVVVLAGELLREAEKLVSQNIHPMTIISGEQLCKPPYIKTATKALDSVAQCKFCGSDMTVQRAACWRARLMM